MAVQRDPATRPALSVVVTIVDGAQTLRECLQLLLAQDGAPDIEVIVPVDHATRAEAAMSEVFPTVRFIDYGAPFDGVMPTDPLSRHRFFDKRRAIGLEHARGDVIAILEDCGFPAPGWASAIIALHEENDEGVIGGAMVQGIDRLKNWGNYFCDFSRYHPPLKVKNPEYITATNISYKRDVIMSVREMWEGKQYQEVKINWELRSRGVGMMLDDRATTISHRHIGSVASLGRELFQWGRIFGQQRASEIGRLTKAKLMLGMPLIPFVLGVRRFRRQLSKGQNVDKYIKAFPIIFVLLFCHGMGELLGYIETPAGGGKGAKAQGE